MSINSSDLQVLVSRVGEAEKMTTLKDRAGQQGSVMAGMGQKVEAERAQQRVNNTPKSEGGKVDKDGKNRQEQQGQREKESGSKQGKKRQFRGKDGHLIDIKI